VIGDLMAAAEAVSDERAFIRLLQAMALDRRDEERREFVAPSSPYAAGANGWENDSIKAFLEAAAAWAEDTPQATPLVAGASDIWRRAAMIIAAGASYE
jgi:hypothetical protein